MMRLIWKWLDEELPDEDFEFKMWDMMKQVLEKRIYNES